MDLARAKTLAGLLVSRFESLDAQHPGAHAASLAFARRMVALLSAAPSRSALQALLRDGRALAAPDCALQEGLYAVSALLRAQGSVPKGD